jgi:hypothetical protein
MKTAEQRAREVRMKIEKLFEPFFDDIEARVIREIEAHIKEVREEMRSKGH